VDDLVYQSGDLLESAYLLVFRSTPHHHLSAGLLLDLHHHDAYRLV